MDIADDNMSRFFPIHTNNGIQLVNINRVKKYTPELRERERCVDNNSPNDVKFKIINATPGIIKQVFVRGILDNSKTGDWIEITNDDLIPQDLIQKSLLKPLNTIDDEISFKVEFRLIPIHGMDIIVFISRQTKDKKWVKWFQSDKDTRDKKLVFVNIMPLSPDNDTSVVKFTKYDYACNKSSENFSKYSEDRSKYRSGNSKYIKRRKFIS